jgi:antitoxin HicB
MSQTQDYTIVLQPEPEGGFTVRVPELPEVVTYGESETEAMAMAKEAIELAVEHRLSRGESLADCGPVSIRNLTISVPEPA